MRRVAKELTHTGMARDGILNQAAAAQLRDEMVQVGESEEQVNLGNFGLQLLLVTLYQAPRGHNRFHPALFELGGAEYRVDRLLFRGVDETAGVDENDVG